MLIFVIVVGVVILAIVLGTAIAVIMSGADRAVQNAQGTVNNKNKGYNLAVTMGHQITVDSSYAEQFVEARRLEAAKAAALPRGANMGIGRLGDVKMKSAGQNLENDSLTALRIAHYHGWDGARTGAVIAAPTAAAAPAAAVSDGGPIELVPGKDYPVIDITDDMSPADKRKARIANSKAKSAALKAAKSAAAPAASAAAAPAVAAAAPVMPATAPEPPALIEISDDMSPDEVRKARIANAKAKSAYNKALKAAGTADGAPAAPAATAPAAPAVPETPEAPTAAASVPEPDYVDITDDMDPDDKRKARIANAKARSAYNKALKAAGIDPKSVRA